MAHTVARHRRAPQLTTLDPYRVMVVDDSAVIRGLIARSLENDSAIRVVSSVGNGDAAIKTIGRHAVDVVVLDIEMPVMDGLTALPQIIAASPRTKVIIASTLTKRNAEISVRALAAGATDYIAKPSSKSEMHSADVFGSELVAKVKALGAAARHGGGALPRPGAAPDTVGRTTSLYGLVDAPTLRPWPATFHPEVIAVGSSTGGPQALFRVLAHLTDGARQPILVTQHMPPTFTAILAQHISRQTGASAGEAKDGERVENGRCYIAPGDFHMTVEQGGAGPIIRLNQDPPVNFCRPAVDTMMNSIVDVYGRGVVATILTGMGTDGLEGCRRVAAAGGAIVAQDDETSVVWGMPGAVAAAGICNAVLPLDEIGPLLRRLALGPGSNRGN
ncbi:MAG: chemotaxis response regulator protein-glutamate methylesterase [Alphaproteobacteria bacterium]